MYPNPSKHIINLEAKHIQSKGLIIYNVIGQDVSRFTQTSQLSDSKISIDLSNLSASMSILKTNLTTLKVYKK